MDSNSAPDSTHSESAFQARKQTLELERLELEIGELKKAWWAKPQYLAINASLMIAFMSVLAKEVPNDIDAVVLLAEDFERQVANELNAALELEEMLLTRRPEEIFAAEDTRDWEDWVRFFSRTREQDGRRKGLVEIEL